MRIFCLNWCSAGILCNVLLPFLEFIAIVLSFFLLLSYLIELPNYLQFPFVKCLTVVNQRKRSSINEKSKDVCIWNQKSIEIYWLLQSFAYSLK